MLSLVINFLLVIEIMVSVLIILVVLMQRPKSEGLGAAFGGGMTENLFGAQTSNVLANFTRWMGGVFFLVTLLLSILYAKQSTQHSSIQEKLLKAAALATPAPSASPAAGTSALSGTAALLSGSATPSAAPFSGADLKLGVPAASPSNALLPAPTLGASPAPALGGTSAH